MKFYDWVGIPERLQRNAAMTGRTIRPEFSDQMSILNAVHNDWMQKWLRHRDDNHNPVESNTELHWRHDKRPYYNMWPSVIPALQKLDMSAVNVSDCRFPFPAIALRFPESGPTLMTADGKHRCRAILVYSGPVACLSGPGIPANVSLQVNMQFAGLDEAGCPGSPETYYFLNHRVGDEFAERGGTVAQELGESTLKAVAYLAVAVGVLANDPDLIEPDVLNDDERKYSATLDPKYIDKAHRRGKVGWHIGRKMDLVPHIRRSHLALMHTGPGRTVPRIVMRKGSVVKRHKATEVPTGFMDVVSQS